MRPISFALVGALGLLTSQAQAGTLTRTSSFGPMLTDFSTGTLSVAGFDTSLGTLTSVSLTLTAMATIGGSVTNNAPGAETFHISTDTEVVLANTGSTINGLMVTVSESERYVLNSGATGIYGPFTPAVSSTVSGTPLSAFTAGPINFTASTLSSFQITGAGNNLSASINSAASGTLRVIYTYAEFGGGVLPASIPEPASLALIGLGLATVGMFRRRSA